jgi:hypothetical protein
MTAQNDPQPQEVLLPELAHSLRPSPFGPMIHHPLLVSFDTEPTRANTLFAHKQGQYDDALAAHNWRHALTFLERAYRLSFLRLWWQSKIISVDILRSELPWVWVDAEPDDTERRWVVLFRAAAKAGRLEDGSPLPEGEILTVYRGQSPNDPRGFARRFNAGGAILAGSVGRADVLAYLTGRGEQEIDVDPRKVADVCVWEEPTQASEVA